MSKISIFDSQKKSHRSLNRQRRSISSKNSALRAKTIQISKQGLLHPKVLNNSLTNQISACGGHRNISIHTDFVQNRSLKGLTSSGIVFKLLSHHPGDRLVDGLDGPVQGGLVEVHHGDVDAVLGGYLGDAGAHLAGADDGHVADLAELAGGAEHLGTWLGFIIITPLKG